MKKKFILGLVAMVIVGSSVITYKTYGLAKEKKLQIEKDRQIKLKLEKEKKLEAEKIEKEKIKKEKLEKEKIEKDRLEKERLAKEKKLEEEKIAKQKEKKAQATKDKGNQYKGTYKIDVNRAANTVTVYTKDKDGGYTKPYKAMVCSTGPATPLGSYYIPSRRSEVRALYGNVFGIYVTNIVDDILFHSVPAKKARADTIIGEEYNKLGTPASMGCVRLSVPDAKWVMENAKPGTLVRFYDDPSNPGPLGKPVPLKMQKKYGVDPHYE